MAAKYHLSLKGWLLWSVLIFAGWYAGSMLLTQQDEQLHDMCARLQGLPEEKHVQLHIPGKELRMEQVLHEKRHIVPSPVGLVQLTPEQTADCFAVVPLAAQDMAVLLRKLQSAGVHSIGISAPFNWEQQPDELTRKLFAHSLKGFRHSVLGLRGRTAAQADFTPEILRSYAIPPAQIEGNPTGLPAANKPMPNGLADTPDSSLLNWAPDWLDDESYTQRSSAVEDISFPLLMRWNGEIIPTLPLRLALEHLGLRAEDVGVSLGKDIRFGRRVLPLDEHGRTRIHVAQVQKISLPEVLAGEGESLKKLGERSCVVLTQPVSATVKESRDELLAATVSELLGREKTDYTKVMQPMGGRVLEPAGWTCKPLWQAGGLAVAVILLSILAWFPGFLRFLASLGLLVGVGIVLWKSTASGLWVPVSGLLVSWFLYSLALIFLRPVKENLFTSRSRRRREP